MSYQPIWQQTLQQASFGGIPFYYTRIEETLGQRLAKHFYPFSDVPFYESMGAALKSYTFEAFLVGDDVAQQRADFTLILNTPGNQTLIHPSKGRITAMLESASFLEESGRVIKCRLAFVVANDRASPLLYPSTYINTSLLSQQSSLNLAASAVLDFLSAVNGAVGSILAPIQQVVSAVVSTSAAFFAVTFGPIGAVLAIVDSVRGMVSIFGGLGVNFGRYNQGQITFPSSVLATIDQTLPIASRIASATTALLAAAVTNQAAINAASTAALAMQPNTAGFAQAVQSVVELSRQNLVDPTDQVQMLAVVAAFTPASAVGGTSPINLAVQNATAASAFLCRCAALLSLARATADYAPTSSNDAQIVLNQIVPLFDAAIEYAADNGYLGSYSDLRAARSAVVTDLQTRGSALPSLIVFTLNTSLPSLPLAYRLYGDASRADDLIARANPIDPSFFPLSFTALSS